MKKTGPKPSPYLSGLDQYSSLKTKLPIDLFCHANEGIAPPDWVLDILTEQGATILSRYPKYPQMENIIANMLSINPEQVLLTAGGDDVIDRACRTYLGPGKRMLLPSPSFDMFELFGKVSGGEIKKIPWLKQNFPVEKVSESITPDTGIIVIISPNNPTGSVITADELRTLSKAAPNALLLVDLAYIEFADEDITATALSLPNAMVLRTFSKGWGLAGLRVGFAASAKELIDPLRIAGAPCPVSTVSLALTKYWLSKGDTIVQDRIKRVKKERAELSDHLKRLGANPFPSQANFVFAEFSNPQWIQDALAGLGVAVRYIPSQGDFKAGIRVSCPCDKNSFARLCDTLLTACAPEAIFIQKEAYTSLAQSGFSDTKHKLIQINPDSKERSAQFWQEMLSQLPNPRAWFVGNSDDFLLSAKREGIVPIRFSTLKDKSETEALESKNPISARILTCVKELEELLP